MKNTRATLAPVNWSRMDAIEMPITPAKAQNTAWAVLAFIVRILKLRKKMKPKGASITTQISGELNSVWPNCVIPTIWPPAPVTTDI